MRLICPNCGAQYEVEDIVIPEDGRDVQCSNCGHTWFQRPAHLDQDLADELDEHMPEIEGEDGTPTTPSGKPERERRSLDPQVTDVLRQEAEREAAARKAESAGLETQPELGLDDSADRTSSRTAAARARMARLRGTDDGSPEAAAAALAAASASRRDLLPDIEEINSSLRASQDRTENKPAQPTSAIVEDKAPRRSSSRLGFTLVLLLAVIAVAIYIFAPQIARAVPQTESFLISYVDFANAFRLRASQSIDMIVTKVRSLIGV